MENNYTYQVFKADDHSNARVNAARKSFERENTACYTISLNGQMQMIQFEGEFPYPANTIEESAQAHIAAIIAAQETDA